jgi:hypothetical protein
MRMLYRLNSGWSTTINNGKKKDGSKVSASLCTSLRYTENPSPHHGREVVQKFATLVIKFIIRDYKYEN